MEEFNEPWESILGAIIHDADDNVVADCRDRPESDRIAACVNYLAGVPQETLEKPREQRTNAELLALAVLLGEPVQPLLDALLEQHQGLGLCQYEGCVASATHKAMGRLRTVLLDDATFAEVGHPGVDCYCERHAKVVADEGDPEYPEECPHCGCLFGTGH